MSYRRLTELSLNLLTAKPAKEELKRRGAAGSTAKKSPPKSRAGGNLDQELRSLVLETANAVRELVISRLLGQANSAVKNPRS